MIGDPGFKTGSEGTDSAYLGRRHVDLEWALRDLLPAERNVDDVEAGFCRLVGVFERGAQFLDGRLFGNPAGSHDHHPRLGVARVLRVHLEDGFFADTNPLRLNSTTGHPAVACIDRYNTQVGTEAVFKKCYEDFFLKRYMENNLHKIFFN